MRVVMLCREKNNFHQKKVNRMLINCFDQGTLNEDSVASICDKISSNYKLKNDCFKKCYKQNKIMLCKARNNGAALLLFEAIDSVSSRSRCRRKN